MDFICIKSNELVLESVRFSGYHQNFYQYINYMGLLKIRFYEACETRKTGVYNCKWRFYEWA